MFRSSIFVSNLELKPRQVPGSTISRVVYHETSLSSFVVWSLDCIYTHAWLLKFEPNAYSSGSVRCGNKSYIAFDGSSLILLFLLLTACTFTSYFPTLISLLMHFSCFCHVRLAQHRSNETRVVRLTLGPLGTLNIVLLLIIVLEDLSCDQSRGQSISFSLDPFWSKW